MRRARRQDADAAYDAWVWRRAAVAAGLWRRTDALAQQLRPFTPFIELGPFYPVNKPLGRDADLTLMRGRAERAKGQIIHLVGRVLTRSGEPVPNAAVELWQANSFGRYNHPADPNPAAIDQNFQGYGVQTTDF